MSDIYYECSECEAVNLGDGPCPNCQAKSELAAPAGSARTEDMAMLIRRLCRVVARHDANNTVREQALDYLHRKGLGGSPLRGKSAERRTHAPRTMSIQAHQTLPIKSQRGSRLRAVSGSEDGVILTQHALERYMERCGATKIHKSLNRIERLAARAVRIGQNRFYADGWILKVAQGEIVTMYRPKHARDLKQIYRAMNPPNDQAQRPEAK